MERLLQWARTQPGKTGAEFLGRQPRRNHSAAFKAKAALEAVKGDKTVAEIVQTHDVHPNQAIDWRRQLLDPAVDVFGGVPLPAEPAVDLKALHAKIAQLTLESDFLEGALIAA